MSDGDDLISKADALLSKYQLPADQQENPLPDIPVLTEVVEAPSEFPLFPAPEADASFIASPIDLPFTFSDRELKQLEEKLCLQVLLGVEPHLAKVLGELLETRIKNHLDPAFDRLAKDITNAVKEEAEGLVSKAVAEAVEREIGELQAGIKGGLD